MNSLTLVHRLRKSNHLDLQLDLKVPIWSTCLRQIAFLSPTDFAKNEARLKKYDQVFQTVDAFEFLLKAVCGLLSTIPGETEIQGQFKQFLKSLHNDNPIFANLHSSFFQNILNASKQIRTSFLSNLGSNSYGSSIRRHAKESSMISILGSGFLTKEILPWIQEASKIQIHTRSSIGLSDLKRNFPQIEVLSFAQKLEGSTLVVAAPISNRELFQLLTFSALSHSYQLIDLRGESTLKPLQLQSFTPYLTKYISLNEIMKEIRQNRKNMSDKINQAMTEINRHSQSLQINSVGGFL